MPSYNDTVPYLGCIVQHYREQAGLSTGELAFALGFSVSGVEDVELHRYVPHPDAVDRMAECFSVFLGVDVTAMRRRLRNGWRETRAAIYLRAGVPVDNTTMWYEDDQ